MASIINSIPQIAEQYGCSEKTLRKKLKPIYPFLKQTTDPKERLRILVPKQVEDIYRYLGHPKE